MEIAKIKLKDLVLDMEIYPRTSGINQFHVSELKERIEAGATLPPLLADRKTKTLVDGWHRYKAYMALYGQDYEVDVELKDYANKGEMLVDTIKINWSHGKSLTMYDITGCLIKADRLGVSHLTIASVAGIALQKVALAERTRVAFNGTEPVPLKKTTQHLANTNLTGRQIDYNKIAGGLHQGFYVKQVVAMLQNDTVNWGNPDLIENLLRLRDLLDERFAEHSSDINNAVVRNANRQRRKREARRRRS